MKGFDADSSRPSGGTSRPGSLRIRLPAVDARNVYQYRHAARDGLDAFSRATCTGFASRRVAGERHRSSDDGETLRSFQDLVTGGAATSRGTSYFDYLGLNAFIACNLFVSLTARPRGLADLRVPGDRHLRPASRAYLYAACREVAKADLGKSLYRPRYEPAQVMTSHAACNHEQSDEAGLLRPRQVTCWRSIGAASLPKAPSFSSPDC